MPVLGIGTDIIECERIAGMIEKHGELFINRVYTVKEACYCQSRKQGTQHFAGRWAAKEAILKALGTGWRRGITWRDMEILKRHEGGPYVQLHGRALEVSREMGIEEIQITISHCKAYATAFAIAQGRGEPLPPLRD
ncbi:Holo-[acyl-carrier-protein] synthase [Planctomycetales bacterium 10988]|nr:Holo-[acyl-carrier-protein] synthase [Planctomycetales bacterium 10988]